ncbi:MAG: ABC transporter ATP-binding protein/permease [Firmicutes bacterium]|nr:ABC transporter ATP-binding protein/permease [Bacillota bacterium]
MLKLDKIRKVYPAGDGDVEALKGISIEFRENEFVSVLGPSGCGKTTLLNIIGGLDRYTSGDLNIDGISTREYRDRDWDAYRNHTIGFVFQSYNLIGHQSVLDNVAVALTLSGVGKAERRRRALEALDAVGIKDQAKKKPNQLSGGQMQRVAIARALVNDPSVILADEPTGALDTGTSEQIMKILAEVARDRLVIMVTHNPELAREYSTRIIKLKDGEVLDDSNPIEEVKQNESIVDVQEELAKRSMGRTSMSWRTALKLSFKNLLTKKTRTLLTAIAGSIGIIGVALIISITNGMNLYIDRMQRDMFASMPMVITQISEVPNDEMIRESQPGFVYPWQSGTIRHQNLLTNRFLEFVDENVAPLTLGENTALHVYETRMNIWHMGTDDNIRMLGVPNNTNAGGAGAGNVHTPYNRAPITPFELPHEYLMENLMETVATVDDFPEILASIPTGAIPLTVVMNQNRRISQDLLLLLTGQHTEAVRYTDILGQSFRLVYNNVAYRTNDADNFDFYYDQYNLNRIWNDGANTTPMYIARIVRQTPNSPNPIGMGLGFPQGLRQEVAHDARTMQFHAGLATRLLTLALAQGITGPIQMPDLENGDDTNIIVFDHAPMINLTRRITNINPDNIAGDSAAQVMIAQIMQLLSSTRQFGLDITPMFGMDDVNGLVIAVQIHPATFRMQQEIANILEQWNEENPDNVVRFTNHFGVMVDNLRELTALIGMVLIGIVGISLIVSTLMIGIITYVSVIERTKEIGVLRSIGARKKDIRRVFGAETAIIGFVAGSIGVFMAFILSFPVSAIGNRMAGVPNIATMPWWGAVGLVLLSCALTLTAGFFPSRIAAKRDPVVALRSE